MSLFFAEFHCWALPNLVGSPVVDRLTTCRFHLLLLIGWLVFALSALFASVASGMMAVRSLRVLINSLVLLVYFGVCVCTGHSFLLAIASQFQRLSMSFSWNPSGCSVPLENKGRCPAWPAPESPVDSLMAGIPTPYWGNGTECRLWLLFCFCSSWRLLLQVCEAQASSLVMLLFVASSVVGSLIILVLW